MNNKLRTIIAVLGILFFCVHAEAQINLGSNKTIADDLCIIGEISGGAAINVAYFLATMEFNNRTEHKVYGRIYDDNLTIGILVYPQNIELALGHNIEETLQSLDQIIAWNGSASEGNSTTFNDVEGREVMLSKNDRGVLVSIIEDIDEKRHGGATLTPKHLQKAIEVITEKAPKKLYDFLIKTGKADHPFVKTYLDADNIEITEE